VTPPELRMHFADRAAFLAELGADLRHGRAFVQGATGVTVLDDCVLLLVRPGDGAQLRLHAQAVFVATSQPNGIGVQLRPFDAAVAAQLASFAAASVCDEPPSATPDPDHLGSEESAACAQDDPALLDGLKRAADEQDPASLAAPANEGDSDDDDDASPAEAQQQPARHERLRKLTPTQQQKLARTGDYHDRVMLERLHGRNVWEALLQNPKLSLPEVARIARKGTVPRPLIEYISENAAWIQTPLVRRALLGNPRVGAEAIMKLLRLTPKHELKTIHKTNTYSMQVREAARKVLDA
jgi:Tfp pilus assembly protein PilZ